MTRVISHLLKARDRLLDEAGEPVTFRGEILRVRIRRDVDPPDPADSEMTYLPRAGALVYVPVEAVDNPRPGEVLTDADGRHYCILEARRGTVEWQLDCEVLL